MNTQLALFSVFLLLIRWLFYLSPRGKHILLYGLKAAAEIAGFLLLYHTPLSAALAISGLLIVLNLLCYVVEVKIFQSGSGRERLQNLDVMVGLVLYAAAFVFIFRSGHIDGFSPALLEWAEKRRILSSVRPYYLVIGGFIAVSEAEHISRFLRTRFAKDNANVAAANAAYQAAGYAERAAVLALVLLSQFTAAGIIIAGRLISAGWMPERENHAAFTMLSLAWALAFSLAMRLFL